MHRLDKSLLAALYTVLLLRPALSSQSAFSFKPIDGFLCINSQFVLNFNGVSLVQCAGLCGVRPQCQAFSLSDGPCQLFVFDKCSKSVRDCGCSRRGRVFVRQQAGLSPGLLCPAGYGDDLCGVKYRVYDFGSDRLWETGRHKCESESGLVIMADVTSSAEMSHVESLRQGNSLWLGGFQPPGSAEPRGGWYWIGCNITVDSSLWAANEPNDGTGTQQFVAAYNTRDGLSDFNSGSAMHGLCECLSPFN